MVRLKNILKGVAIFTFVFLFKTTVHANTCTTEDVTRLNELAGKIKTKYDVIEVSDVYYLNDPEDGTTYEIDDSTHIINVTVLNIHPDTYVIQTNENTGNTRRINYSDTKDGTYRYTVNDASEMVKYTYKVYSNASSGCKDNELKTYNFVQPKQNNLASYEACRGNEDLEICSLYTDQEFEIIPEQLPEEIEKYRVQSDKEETKTESVKEQSSLTEGIKNTLVKIVLPVLVVGVLVVITIYYIVKRKRRDII